VIHTTPLEPEAHLVELDRPERRNALDLAAIADLHAALRGAVDDGARSLVIAGRGGGFCSGGDLRAIAQHGAEYAVEMGETGQALTHALAAAPLLTIAVIEGPCVGGGAELALACDVRVAVSSSFWMFPEVRTGAIPAWGGTQTFARHVGEARARQMLLTGRPVGSEMLVLGGLIAAIMPDRDAAMAEAMSYVADAAASSRPAFTAIKTLIAMSAHAPREVGAWAELQADRRLSVEFTEHATGAYGDP
jgi:enoyl-CoA hydratase/carnithine racemase